MLRLISFVFVSCCAVLSYADNVRIYGKVRDENNSPIEFATVRIDGFAHGVNTNIKGEYSLTFEAKDTVAVVYSCVGYKSVTHRLIRPEGDIHLAVKLYPAEITLKGVEVNNNSNVINGMTSYSVDSYKDSPDVSGGSVESMLATLPGVNSSNELSSGYSVRGGAYDENSVYINGAEILRPQLLRNGQQEGLSIINPDMVGDIKFSTAGFPARYSDKMSSVLDITYRRPRKFESSIGLSLSGGSFSLGTSTEKFSMLHGVRLKKNNTLLSTLDTKGEYDPLFFDYQTNIVFEPNNKFSINLLGNVSVNNFNFKPSDRETSFGTVSDLKNFKVYFDGKEEDRFNTISAMLGFNYRHSRTSVFSLAFAGFSSGEYVSYDISGEYWLNQAGSASDAYGGELGVGKYMEHARDRLDTKVFSAIFKGSTAAGVNHISYGIGFSHEKFRDRMKEWEWRDSAGYSLPVGPDGVNLVYNLQSRKDISNNRLSVYLEDALYLETSRAFITLNLGVRGAYWDFNKEFIFSPRLNLSVSPVGHNNIVYRFSTGIFRQSPFYKEYRQQETDDLGNTSIRLNSGIKSPQSINFMLGADYTFSAFDRPFKLTGEIYCKMLSKLVSYEYDNLKVTYSGVNDSKGFIAGADFRLFGQFVPGTDSWLSLSLMKTQQDLRGRKVPLPMDQRYAVNLYLTDYFPKFPKLRFSLRGIFSDGLTMTAPRMTRDEAYFRAPSYKRVDIGMTYHFISPERDGVVKRNFLRHFRSLSLGIDVFNLFDISNVSSYYWVTDVNNLQYAVPNYLTRRQLNFSIKAEL